MTRRSGAKRKKAFILSAIVILVIVVTVFFTSTKHRISLKHFGAQGDGDVGLNEQEAGQEYEESINGSGVQSTDEIEDMENEENEHKRPDVKEDLRKWKQDKMDKELQKGNKAANGGGGGGASSKDGRKKTSSEPPSRSGSGASKPASKSPPPVQQQQPKTKKIKPFNSNKNIGDEDDETVVSKNPNNFLGDVDELSPDEMELVGDIYDKSTSTNENEPKQLREGIPPSGVKFDKATIDVVEYPSHLVTSEFRKLKLFNFRIYSHNIKNGADQRLQQGEEIWSNRFRMIAASIKFNCQSNCVVALQEVYKFQLDDILKELNRYEEPNTWAYYGVGRIDGKSLGEYVPILYKTSEFDLIYGDSFWLNERNPRVSSVGWDSAYPKIVSYVTVKHKLSQNYLNIFNTQFDYSGDLAKVGAAKLILDTMNSINDWPSFLAGDLNTEANHKSYKQIIESYHDVAKLVTPFNTYGHERSSVTGFEGEALLNGGRNIDYIFAPSYTLKVDAKPVCDSLEPYSASNKILLRLQSWGMLHSKFNGKYMSNHRPLVADFSMGGKC